MDDLVRVRRQVAELAQRPRNVRIAEISRIVDQLANAGFKSSARKGKHGILFQVRDETFMVSPHKEGSSQAKEYAVKGFLQAMYRLGVFASDDDDES